MAPTPSTVSFTVRRPTPTSRPSSSGPESDGPFKVPALPRHLASAGSSAAGSPLAGSPRTFSSREDSDDDGESGIVFANSGGAGDDAHHTDSSDDNNFVVGAGQRLRQKKKPSDLEAPLVIPTKPNPDWREAAKRRRAACSRVQPHTSRGTPSFVPDSAVAATGADGSVGGLGTRDTINSGPQLSGLQINKRVKIEAEGDDTVVIESVSMISTAPDTIEETEDQRALRAILAGEDESASAVDTIPVPPLSESDALKQDVQELPDVASADDYERVPISAFGAAMLRGMGWTDGAVASKVDKRRKNGLKELYLPQARPALLGIGAKERELEDDGSGKKKPKGSDMRYVPVARKEGESSRSGTASRRTSRSPSRKERKDRGAERRSGYDDRERRRERDRDRDCDDEGRRRMKDYDDREHKRRDYRDKGRDRDRERDRSRSGREPYRGRESEGNGKRYDQRDERDSRDRR